MDFWLAIVIITALGTLSSMYFAKLNVDRGGSKKIDREVDDRVAKLEERLANIESVLIDIKKEQRFNELRD